MKKTITGGVLILALTAGVFVGFSGCQGELSLNQNTKITTLERALAKENYTTVYEMTNGNQYQQIVNMYDENFALTVVNKSNGESDKYYSFINFENDNLMHYQVHQSNNQDGELNENGAFKIVSSAKQLAIYGGIEKDFGNIDLLATQKGKLVAKNNTISLRFGNNSITTTDADGTKITIKDVGSTHVKLTGEILNSAIHSSWQEEVFVDGVRYTLNQNAYTAIIDDDFWAKNAHANILAEVNTLDVVNLEQNGTIESYAGRTITLPIASNEGSLISEADFCYNLAKFVQLNGKVEFLDQTIEKTPITQTTTIDELSEIINNKNYTFKKSKTAILAESTNKDYITENITYQNREYVKETIQIIAGQTFLTTEYGIFVGENYYRIVFTNYDTFNGQLYADNAFVYSECTPADPNQHTKMGAEILSKLVENDGKLQVVESSTNYAEISFEYGNLTITTLFGEKNTDGAFKNFGNEVLHLENVSTSCIEIPDYVIETILQQYPID